MLMDCGSRARPLDRNPYDAVEAVGDESIGLLLNPCCHVSVSGTAVRRVVFEAAESRRIVRRCDDYAIRKSAAGDPGCS